MKMIKRWLLLFLGMLLFHAGFAQINDGQKEKEMEQAVEATGSRRDSDSAGARSIRMDVGSDGF